MASHKEKEELLALYKLFEGIEDAITYTVGAEAEEHDLAAIPRNMQSDDNVEFKKKKPNVSLPKRGCRDKGKKVSGFQGFTGEDVFG